MGDSMGILLFVFGMLVGFLACLCAVVKVQAELDKKIINDGVIKIEGSIYKLDKIDL